MSGDDIEAIRRETRVYLTVFVALAALTTITVVVSSLHLSVVPAVVAAIFIAAVKGSLVAGYFMHLLSEKKVIYSVLVLVAILLVAILLLPVGSFYDAVRI